MRYMRENYIKWASYGILLLGFFLLQTSYYFRFSVFGIRPDLLPFFIAAVALFEGPACAATVGFFTGLMCDFVLTGLDGVYPFYYICVGVLTGFLTEKYFRRNIFSGLVIGLLLSAAQNLFKYVFYYALFFQASVFTGMRITLAELVVSALFSPLVYIAVKHINRHFAEEDDD